MELGLGAFIKFVNARPGARPRLASELAAQARSEYSPVTDFWRPMRHAISVDRKTTRDGEPLRQLVLGATPKRRASYLEVSDRYDDIAERWGKAQRIPAHRERVGMGDVDIRLCPLVNESWDDGRSEHAFFWFNKEELAHETIVAVRHILASGNNDDHAVPVFIDARRAYAVTAREDASVAPRLEALGADFQRHARGQG